MLPLSCHQTRAAVAYLLEKSGFEIEMNQWLAHVNDYFVGTGKSESRRYMIIARKLEQNNDTLGRLLVAHTLHALAQYEVVGFYLYYVLTNPLSNRFWPKMGFRPLLVTYIMMWS